MRDKRKKQDHLAPSYMLNRFTMCERTFSSEHLGGWSPPTDIFETEDSVLVLMECPGMEEEDVEVTFDGDKLVITGEKKRKPDESGVCCYCIERGFGRFRRAFELSVPIDPEGITASYKRGILRVTLPRKQE